MAIWTVKTWEMKNYQNGKMKNQTTTEMTPRKQLGWELKRKVNDKTQNKKQLE